MSEATCVDHAELEATSTCHRCGAFLCFDCAFTNYCHACSRRVRIVQAPRRIGGFLLVVMSTLFVQPLAFIVTAVRIALELRAMGLTDLLEENEYWLSMAALTLGFRAALATFALVILPGFFQRLSKTIKRLRVFCGLWLGGNLLFVALNVTSHAPFHAVEAMLAVIGLTYVIRSMRVKDTFTR